MDPSRRHFLGAACATLASCHVTIRARSSATGAGSNCTVPAAGGPARGRILRKALGIGMIDVPGTLADRFLLARDCGFAGIEMDAPSDLATDEVLAARDAAGLEIPSVVDSVHWRQTLADPDPEVRRAGRAGLEAALRAAADYGARSVLLVPCVVRQDIPYDLAWQRSQDEILRVLPLARELGVRIAIENVWNQFIMSPLEAARYVDELGGDPVGWHLDLGNLVTYGWPEHWVRALGPRVLQLHVKDFSRKKRDEEGLWKGFAVELGEGDVDWPATMRALDEIRFDGWGIAEVAGGDEARLRDVSARMDRIFAG
jgi:hexulose-6-phosphate isomerase